MNTRSMFLVAFMAGLVAMTAGQAPILSTEPCNQLTIGEVADALNYTVLGDLLEETGLYNALNGSRYTLVAPSNAAFVSLLGALNTTVANLLKFPAVVSSLLKYHVVNSTNAAAFLANQTGSVNVTTLAGSDFQGSNLTFIAGATPTANFTVRAGDNNATAITSRIYNNSRCGINVVPVSSVLIPRGVTQALVSQLAPTAPTRAPTRAPAKAPAPAPVVAAKAPAPSLAASSTPTSG